MFISQLILSVHLQVSVPPGALDCWVFLSCLEVLQRIEGCCDRAQIEANVSHTVGLWSYATEKVSKWRVAVVVLQTWSRTFVSMEQILHLLLWTSIRGSVYCLESSLDETCKFISTFSTVRWGLRITRVCLHLCLSLSHHCLIKFHNEFSSCWLREGAWISVIAGKAAQIWMYLPL